jgi:thiol:disulfide interchange protein/DsbC/DsbD-like thiol-disulfide interchange protein
LNRLNKKPAPSPSAPTSPPGAGHGLVRRVIAALATASARVLALAIALWAPLAQAGHPAVVQTEQVRAELLAHAPQGVVPGQALWLGLKIEHAAHWHTYWKNPGDSGLPTQLVFQLPAGFTVGEIEWPTPQRLPIGPLVNYGYEGTLLLAVPVQVPAGFAGPALNITLRADWLVCKDVCIPEGGDFSLSVPAQSATATQARLFETTRAALAQRPAAGQSAQLGIDGQTLLLRVQGLPSAWQGQKISAFPETAGVIDNAAVPQARWDGAAFELRWALSAQRTESPSTMPVLLALEDGGRRPGLAFSAPVAGTWPSASVAATAPAALGNAQVLPATPSLGLGLLAALGFAFLGGVLLNLMPCVFPVLSLKVLGFADKAQQRRQLLAGGLAYTVGVVLSFLALAGLLLALRAGGEQLGWGFQLQEPLVVVALATLFTLIGLNLAGVFEFGMLLPSGLASARARHPLLDSALTGVLAVAIASPCTAPFMGASLGLAATLPAAQALAIFGALGLGMALPYLAASAWPGLARALPRPGVWMQHFKLAMAFPMFATVVWLVWVLGHQVGIDGAAALLLLLVLLAFAAWALAGRDLGRSARLGLGGLAVLLLGAGLAWAWPGWRALPAERGAALTPASDLAAHWQPWSERAVADALAAGRPVFVDFTAAWCVSCQVNKRSTLSNDAVLKAFEAKRVLTLRADWTRRDSSITQALAALGRNGVPVYALYAPSAASPQLLSEILLPGEVMAALQSLP